MSFIGNFFNRLGENNGDFFIVAKAIFDVEKQGLGDMDKTSVTLLQIKFRHDPLTKVYTFDSPADFWLRACYMLPWAASIYYELSHSKDWRNVFWQCMNNFVVAEAQNDPEYYVQRNISLIAPQINMNSISGKTASVHFCLNSQKQLGVFKYDMGSSNSLYQLYFYTHLYRFFHHSFGLEGFNLLSTGLYYMVRKAGDGLANMQIGAASAGFANEKIMQDIINGIISNARNGSDGSNT